MKDFSITPELESPRPCRSLLRICKKKYRKIRQCHEKKGNRKLGMWNLDETIRYIGFIKLNQQKFASEDTRRQSRVFSLMAHQMRSRNAIQCRSHHQKMVQTYGNLQKIVNHYQSNVIPYYSVRAKEWEHSHKTLTFAEDFWSVSQKGNSLRIQIDADYIQAY